MTTIVQKIEDVHGVRDRFGFVVPKSLSCNQIRIVHKRKIAPRERTQRSAWWHRTTVAPPQEAEAGLTQIKIQPGPHSEILLHNKLERH